MPREFANPPSSPKDIKKRFAGEGREIEAFMDEENEDLIIAYFKESSFFRENPLALITLYQTLYCHKILNILFPQNFPEWLDAGMNRDGYVASVRRKAKGKIAEKKDSSVELKKIRELFKKYNISIGLDLARPNVFFHNNVEKYVDSTNVFINGNSDIEKLSKLMDKLKTLDKIKKQVERIAKRIIVLHKFKNKKAN